MSRAAHHSHSSMILFNRIVVEGVFIAMPKFASNFWTSILAALRRTVAAAAACARSSCSSRTRFGRGCTGRGDDIILGTHIIMMTAIISRHEMVVYKWIVTVILLLLLVSIEIHDRLR